MDDDEAGRTRCGGGEGGLTVCGLGGRDSYS